MKLEGMNYVTKYRSPFGSVELIVRDSLGTFTAVGDPRGDDSAAGKNKMGKELVMVIRKNNNFFDLVLHSTFLLLLQHGKQHVLGGV